MRLRPYSDRVAPRFCGVGPYYLGVELEVEAPDREKRDMGLASRKRPHHLYAKHDGSLNKHGWELITHPVAGDLWLERGPLKAAHPVRQFLALVADLKSLGYSSHSNGRCGLHIHVSKSAWGATLQCRAYYWFCCLINGKLFRRLSQREDERIDRFAKQSPPRAASCGSRYGQHSRYVAVNQTQHTVEVRIFRGNMREERIRKAIEAVIAAIEFGQAEHRMVACDDLDALFRQFVGDHRDRFPNLHRYLADEAVVDAPPTPTATTVEEPAVCV